MTPDPRSYPRTSIMVKLEIFCNVKRDYSHWSYKKANELKKRRQAAQKLDPVAEFRRFMEGKS